MVEGTEGLFFVRGGEVFFRDLKLPKGDGAVVALDEDVVLRGKALALGGAGGAVDGDFFLNGLLLAVAVEDLNLVASLKVNAGVRAFWDEEFCFDGAVAELRNGW